MTTLSTAPSATTVPLAPPRAAAVAGAVLLAVLGWVVAVPLLDVDLAVSQGGTEQVIGVAQVAGAALVASLLGWASLAVVERRSRRPRQLWTSLALVVLVVSLGAPLSSGATTGARLGLAALHLAVAAVLVPALRRTVPAR